MNNDPQGNKIMNDDKYGPIYLFGTELAMPDSNMKKAYYYTSRGHNVPPSVKAEIRICNLDRDVALLSMDKDKILDYANKYEVNMANLPSGDDDFWAAVHIAISAVESLPMERRSISKRYLLERGLEVFDDGLVSV